MSSAKASHDHAGSISGHRVEWITLLAAISSAAYNVLISRIVVELLGVPSEFVLLDPGLAILCTLATVLGVTLLFAIVGRFTRDPRHLFWKIGMLCLLLLFLGDIVLLSAIPLGATVAGIMALMLMQSVSAGIDIILLTALAWER